MSGEAPLFQTATHTNVLIVVGEFDSKFLFLKSICILICLGSVCLSGDRNWSKEHFSDLGSFY